MIDEWLIYSIENGTIDPLPIQKLFFLFEAMCSLISIHLGFPKSILMTVPIRFIYSLVVVIDKRTCS